MKKIIYPRSYKSSAIKTAICLLLLINGFSSYSQSVPTTIPAGSFIINMGIVPQTQANSLYPYGMIYDQLKHFRTPIDWVINTSKAKDGTDFTYGGTDFKGGPFIIEAKYRTAEVNANIAYWQSLGVQGVTTTSDVTVPLFCTFWNAPNWTMDLQNGQLYTPAFTYAKIPGEAFGGYDKSGWKLPSQLNCCDDVFAMPHADPTWATHSNLIVFNANCRSGIWLGCHAGSAEEDLFNPADPNVQMNFLCNKSGPATSCSPDYCENALILWGNHGNGTPPYSYDYAGEPIMQFMGSLDAATLNGSEQIYIPAAGSGGWRSTTHLGVYDPDHPQALGGGAYTAAELAYGPAFGDTSRGRVMMEACHSVAKGTSPEQCAGMRAFFNFAWLVTWEKAVIPQISNLPDTLSAGNTSGYQLSYTIPAGANPAYYHPTWYSTCGGTFIPNNTVSPVTYMPPVTPQATACSLSVEIKDDCNRVTFDTHIIWVKCKLYMTPTITTPSCHGLANGAISMAITGGDPPFSWSWTRTNPAGGPVNGTGTNITGLSSGTYEIAVSVATGCSDTFTVFVPEPEVLTASSTTTNVLCFGGTGTINLTAQGGTTPYTYNWADIPGTIDPEDRSGISAGTYSVTVTDSKGCTATNTAIVSGPSATLAISGILTNVSCYGGNNGAIDITVTGGTSPYTYSWNGGITTQDRTNLTAGSYSVVVTDANGCTKLQSFTVTQPAALNLSTIVTQPTCPPGAQQYGNNGAIDLSVTGGTQPYAYSWTASSGGIVPPGQATNQDLTLLVAGNYSVTVTDNKGCVKSTSVTLTNLNPNPVQPNSINH
ncbi:MAG TPA: SprB repeat-containing protein [Bacteroidales bacterium]|nr:SprB repeat-containing protein [Bacteroidales bacterium]